MNMLERISVEALLPPPTAPGFWLDADALGEGTLGNIAEGWTPITDEVRDISIKRGSPPDKLTTSPDVGTLTLTLVDPPITPWRPSTPIRVTGDGNLLFTGSILDIRETEHRPSPGGTARNIVTITAVDRVRDLANTMRYGAYQSAPEEYPWLQFETAAQRFVRYLRPTGYPWQGADPAEIYGSGWAGVYNYKGSGGYDENTPPSEAGPTTRLITYEPGSLNPRRTRFSLAQEGRGIQLGLYQYDRAPAAGDYIASLWIRPFRSTEGDEPPRLRLVEHAASVAGTIRSESPLPPLQLDRWQQVDIPFTFTGSSALGALFLTNDEEYMAPTTPAAAVDQAGFEVAGLVFTRGSEPSGLPVQNIVYESTLTNHLDLTANTTNGAWWIDVHNVIQTRTRPTFETAAPVLTLTDGTGPGEASYVDLDLSYDTAGIVNDLTFDNHGRAFDEEQRSWLADDVKIRGGTDPTSIATYGPRSEELPTALPVTQPTPHILAEHAPRILAQDYLATASRPHRAPRYVRIWHDPNRPPLPGLDVRDETALTRAGMTWPATITGLSHQINRHHWHTDLTLIPRKEDS